MPFPFVGDKDRALFRGHFLQRSVNLIEQNTASIGRLRSTIERRQQVFKRDGFAVVLAVVMALLAVTVNAIGRKRAASVRARERGAEYPAEV